MLGQNSLEKFPQAEYLESPELLAELKSVKNGLNKLGVYDVFHFDIVPEIIRKTRDNFVLSDGELNKHDIYHLMIGSSLSSDPLPLTDDGQYNEQFMAVDKFMYDLVMEYYRSVQD